MRKKWTESDLEVLRNRYPKEGPDLLSSEWSVSSVAVTKAANRYGVRVDSSTKNPRRSRGIRDGRNKPFDLTFFDSWSPEMAYTLGYVWADGNINKSETALTLACVTDDEEVLLGIREAMSGRNTVYRVPPGVDSRGVPFRGKTTLVFGSMDLVGRLRELGLRPRKSYLDLPFPEIPDEFLAHFTRGLIDGDGCVTRSKKGCWSLIILGTRSFLRGLSRQIHKVVGVGEKEVKGPSQNVHRLSYFRKGELLSLRSWLYPPGCNLYLSRKKTRWDALADQYNVY